MIGLLESDWAPPDAGLVGEAEAGGVDATFGLADVPNCRCCETLLRCCNAGATKLFPRAVGCCNGITCRKSKVLAVAMDVNAVNAGLDAILRSQLAPKSSESSTIVSKGSATKSSSHRLGVVASSSTFLLSANFWLLVRCRSKIQHRTLAFISSALQLTINTIPTYS